MLGYFTPHSEYTHFVVKELGCLANSHPELVKKHKRAIMKMLTLNLDPLLPVIAPLYSPVGRVAKMQMQIFRSFVLMVHMKTALDNWVEELACDPVLRAIAGFTLDNMPQTPSYYDFINRVVPMD